MQRSFARLSTSVVLLLAATSASAAPAPKAHKVTLDRTPFFPALQFDQLTVEDGLRQGQVEAIAQDAAGFMWFGMRDGLQRYDGHAFKLYRANPKQPEGLADNTITRLLVDPDGALWIGTWAGGLTRLDLKTSSMRTYRHVETDPTTLSSDAIGALFLDSAGVLWVGTHGGGLNRLDRQTGQVKRYLNDVEDPESLRSDYVYVILEDSHGELWIGTEGGGLNKLDRKAETFSAYMHDPSALGSLSANTVLSLIEDNEGQLWVGTAQGGINIFERRDETFKVLRHDPSDYSTLSQDTIMALYQDRGGTIWAGTETGALNSMDPKTKIVTRHFYDVADPKSFGYRNVSAIYEDREGTLWFAHNNGLSKLDATRRAFGAYKRMPNRRHTLSHATVHTFQETSDGSLWMGSPGGLERIDRRTGTVRSYPIPQIRSAWVDDEVRYVWIGPTDGGLVRVDTRNAAQKRFTYDPNDFESIGGMTVQALRPMPDGTMWLGFWGQGLDRFDPKTETFEHFPFDPLESDLPSGFIAAIHPSRDGKLLWIATMTAGEHRGGVAAFDPVENTFVVYQHSPKDPASLSSNKVLTVFEDSRGLIWAGTSGGGLNRIDPATKAIKVYTTEHGLPNDTIYGILEDDDGHLWLSTIGGLARLEVESGKFTVYTVHDGLPRNEFIQSSYYKGAEHLYFSSMAGVVVFRPKDLTRNTFVPPVTLTSFSKVNKLVDLGDLADVPLIDLGFRENIFAFEFVALSFRAPQLNQYAYKLEGFDTEWHTPRQGRLASYTNLSGGDYVFRVRGSNNHGVWNEAGAAIRVHVDAPPWKRWWAYTAYVLLAIGAILLYRRYLGQKHKADLERQQLNKDLELTGTVQALFLPKETDYAHGALELASYYRPAAHSSGDWWWYEPRPDGTILVIVGDVTGHGIGSAMVTAIVASSFRTLEVAQGEALLDPRAILERLSDNMRRICQGAFNMTVSMVHIDGKTGDYRWWCAGSPPILKRQDGKLLVVAGRGTPLGVASGFEASEKSGTLQDGEQLLVFTDGVSELELDNGKQLGLKGVMKILTAEGHGSPVAVRDTLVGKLKGLLGSRAADDDITLTVIGKKRAAQPTATTKAPAGEVVGAS